MGHEVRIEWMRPADVTRALERAPVAWLPMGALEYHAPHLPFGTDSRTAERVVERAAQEVGGIVLPTSIVTMGTLYLPWSVRFEADLVEQVVRATVEQAIEAGARVVVVHTGHAPLDLLHLLKRVCGEVEREQVARGRAEVRLYAVCYLELNAALGAALDTPWPVAVDHGSITETSWMLAIEPELVDLTMLPTDGTPMAGIYGPLPVAGRATASLGAAQLDDCVRLLVERTRQLVSGDHVDAYDDLRLLVERYWTEPLTLVGVDDRSLSLAHGGPVSRYLTSLSGTADGRPLDPLRTRLRNASPGEAGVTVSAAELGTESGSYIRRGQAATVELPEALPVGVHDITLELGLAGVARCTVEARLTVA